MKSIDCSLMSSLYASFKPPALTEILQKKKSSLEGEFQNNTNNNADRKEIIKKLQEANNQDLMNELSEETARLAAKQRILDEESSKAKRERDRVFYRKHEEDYIFNASIEKLLLAKGKVACCAGNPPSPSFLTSPKTAIWEQGSQSSADQPTSSMSDEIDDDITQSRKIGIEEAEAARKHKREIIREIEKEEATHIRRPLDNPEPIFSVYAAYKRKHKGKVDKRV